jgi:hypothetical protein
MRLSGHWKLASAKNQSAEVQVSMGRRFHIRHFLNMGINRVDDRSLVYRSRRLFVTIYDAIQKALSCKRSIKTPIFKKRHSWLKGAWTRLEAGKKVIMESSHVRMD